MPGDFRVFESEDFLCSNQKISCVRIKRSPVFESRDFVCSNQKISCDRIKRFPVFESRDFLCSNQDISCVPIKTCPRSHGGHVLADGTGPDGVEFWSYRPQNKRI